MIDWAAKWFEIRSEMGQSDMATFMFQDEGQPLVKAHFHHRETDGFGKLQKILIQEGIQVQAPVRPLQKPNPLLQPYLLLKGLLLHPKLDHNPWKTFNPQAPSAGLEEVSSWFLTESENERLKIAARNRNLNVGFFILSTMDELLKEALYKNPNDSGTWLCPVDVRGAYPDAALNRNWVSFVTVQFKGLPTSTSIQQAFLKYKKSLKSGLYWAYWELYQIGKWIGVNGMRRLAKRAHNKSFWMGSFSDLGVWNQDELRRSKAHRRRWVIAPPGSSSYPVGVTTIEWCGLRSITLKIHPGICEGRSAETAHELMEKFKGRCR